MKACCDRPRRDSDRRDAVCISPIWGMQLNDWHGQISENPIGRANVQIFKPTVAANFHARTRAVLPGGSARFAANR